MENKTLAKEKKKLSWEEIVKRTKNYIAKLNGFEEGVLGSSWEYAMQITYRTKSQIKLYDAVIDALGIYFEEGKRKYGKKFTNR
jgi:hypothetical protein